MGMLQSEWQEHLDECEGGCKNCHCNHGGDAEMPEVCECSRHFVMEDNDKRFFEGPCESYEPGDMHEHCGPGENGDEE